MTTPDFRPTHVVPQDGLPAWEAPDVSRPTEPLDPLLPVRLVGRRGDWGQILCANGWSAWVDGRLLVSVPQEPPAPGAPMARTADPRPLLARVEESLSQYRRAAEDLTAGRTDGEDFRRRTRGLRVGMVVDGEAVWLYDAEHERWVYCDGTRLTTYAPSSPPANPPPREPTQVTAQPPAAPAAGPDPTQLVTPATPDATAPPTGPDDARTAPRDPTQVVTPADDARVTPLEPPQATAQPPAAPREPTQVAAQPPATPPFAQAAGPEPTRVVTSTAPDATGAPVGPDATAHTTGPDDARTAPPEPTQVVTPADNAQAPPPEPFRTAGHAPDRAAPPPEATRVVDPSSTGLSEPPGNSHHPAPDDTRAAPPPEPTRVVDTPSGSPRAPEPPQPADHTADRAAPPPGPTRVVDPPADGPAGPSEPTPGVGAGAARPADSGGRSDGGRGPGPERDVTRLAEPRDGPAPRPRGRPGDG